MAGSNSDLWFVLTLLAGIGIGFVLLDFFRRPGGPIPTGIFAQDYAYQRHPFHQYYNTPPAAFYGEAVPYGPQYFYQQPQAPRQADRVQNHETWEVEYNRDGSVRHIDIGRQISSVEP